MSPAMIAARVLVLETGSSSAFSKPTASTSKPCWAPSFASTSVSPAALWPKRQSWPTRTSCALETSDEHVFDEALGRPQRQIVVEGEDDDEIDPGFLQQLQLAIERRQQRAERHRVGRSPQGVGPT